MGTRPAVDGHSAILPVVVWWGTAGGSGSPVSRLIKRWQVHGLIKQVGPTDQYSLTESGQPGVLTALQLRDLVVIPALAGLLPAAA